MISTEKSIHEVKKIQKTMIINIFVMRIFNGMKNLPERGFFFQKRGGANFRRGAN